MKPVVEPTGIVFRGQCEIRKAVCTALDTGAVTVVWTKPGRIQINVCRSCLDSQLKDGIWVRQPVALHPIWPTVIFRVGEHVQVDVHFPDCREHAAFTKANVATGVGFSLSLDQVKQLLETVWPGQVQVVMEDT